MQVNPSTQSAMQEVQAELGLSVTEAARRAQIVGATIATISDLGYHKTSFAKIKERAGLSSTRIISYHFTNKAGLMQAVVTTATGMKDKFLEERIQGTTDRAGLLRGYIESEIAFLGSYPELVRVMVEMASSGSDAEGWFMSVPLVEEFRTGRLERQLKQGQAEGAFGDFAADVMALSIAQAIDGVAAKFAADPKLDLERYGRELADLFVKATAA
ncbi:TetR/AcrR family transcriptional regulator [Amycolatopsis oliviviridis]|uniref:TetR family transcriptional regulator n=2 Tax=Amycolatopsis oliviviridis TaxID=1471590 RepID=A0ABQ3L8C9_9PSEU|nr:TetR family transcriptional regulator [Amycolatopsis oliviviridis]